MQKLQFRGVYDEKLSKLLHHLDLIEKILVTGYPDIYSHLIDEMVVNPVHLFTSMIQTVFVRDLQSKSPLIASHIFDVFLLDGEKVIFTLLMQFIKLKEEKILDLYMEDL